MLCAVAVLPAFSAFAADDAISMSWTTGQTETLIGKWSGSAPNWDTPEEIKPTSNPRFMTAKDGKIYTINQKTMSIMEISNGLIADKYTLPIPTDRADFYGTAISIDEAGNFLIGMNFTQRPASSLKWAVYNPTLNTIKEFTLPVPNGWNVGRIDCVGRVIGDLTKEAYFFIVPETGYTSAIRTIKVTGDGRNATAMEDVLNVDVTGNYTQQNIAQPAYSTLAEAKAANAVNDFYYSSCCESDQFYAEYISGKVTDNFAPDMQYTTIAASNGFDTFVIGGKRYFVRNYSKTAERVMNVVVMDENGDAVAIWENHAFVLDGGNSSIIAEPKADGTANIYVYNYGNKFGDAALLTFDPAKAGEPVKPEIPVGVESNPYVISTPDELVSMASKISTTRFYVELANDIDMAGVAFTPIKTGATIMFNGKNHVIKNLNATLASAGNAGLFDTFSGTIENLGLVDVYSYSSWGCPGAFVGTAKEMTIKNCFATGAVSGAAVGGLVSTNTGKLTITDCYSACEVKDINGHFAGGLVGRADAPVIINNSYASGAVSASNGVAGGLLSIRNASDVTIHNAIAWNVSVTGKTAEAIMGYIDDSALVYDEENVAVYSDMLLNGTPAGGTDDLATVQAIATSWPAFNDKLNDGYAVLAWQEANGNAGFGAAQGTIDNPYKISTTTDLMRMGSRIVVGDTYFTIENDIDMDGVAYTAPLGNNNFSGCIVHIDGKNHVISNLSCSKGDYPSLIGVFMGEIKNLGLENVNIISGWGAGAFGGFTGHSSYEGTTIIDNCFATGRIESPATGGYAGGIGGYNNGNLVVSNTYVNVAVSGGTNTAGILGLMTGGSATFENVYADGIVDGKGDAAGIITGTAGTANLKNVIAWNSEVNATNNAAAVNTGAITVNAENVNYWNEMLVKGKAVEGGMTTVELQKIATSWDAYNNKIKDERPVLAWQEADGEISGIADTIIEEGADAAPVYYNLQGVEVTNPDNGIYIVRRGNKVTKEYISK